MNTSSNNQAGPAGLGWSFNAGGSVSRLIMPCGAVHSSASTDRCIPDTEVFTLNLGGRGSRLVEIAQVGGVRNFRMEDDPLWRVEFKSRSAGSPDFHGDHWVVTTTTDGTKHFLGTSADSAQWIPIVSPSASAVAAASGSRTTCAPGLVKCFV